MSTDYRALCAELVDIVTAHCSPDDSAVGYCAAVLTRARTALAQPEPVALTRPDCFDFAMDFLGGTEESEVRNYIERLESTARAVLTRWGTPAIQPVPVSEQSQGFRCRVASGR